MASEGMAVPHYASIVVATELGFGSGKARVMRAHGPVRIETYCRSENVGPNRLELIKTPSPSL